MAYGLRATIGRLPGDEGKRQDRVCGGPRRGSGTLDGHAPDRGEVGKDEFGDLGHLRE
jgi:hypothetical protein